jgi:thymidylate synthase
MNKLDKQYTDLLQSIIDYGVEKKDRTGTGTKSIFGYTIRHKMSDGFPLLTTKKMPFKTVVIELLWFLRGDTNIKFLVDNSCHIWDGDAYKNYEKTLKTSIDKATQEGILKDDDSEGYSYLSKESFIERIKTDDEFANKWGELGPIYGKQWRSWGGKQVSVKDGKVVTTINDQIQNLIKDLKTNPDSRRLMVSAWNVGELDQMVLPPCHYGFQVYTRELTYEERRKLFEEKTNRDSTYILSVRETLDEFQIPTRAISLMWNQRSVDTFLGLPFNIASYGLLLMMLADEVNMVPDQLIGNLGDVHLYSNHIEQAKEQIGRKYTPEEREAMLKDAMSWRLYNKAVNELMPFGGGMSEYYDAHKIPYYTREPYSLPTITLPSSLQPNSGNWDKLVFEDFYLNDYQSHPSIKAPLSN